eukprot:maker-scaffold582_size130280-snap-gene-0.21 protein:Tk11466 transcript:maker-scaffold582_size130280-snap-gene-0.21-mRNA-1 annotation:"udp-glucuronosyltransferase 2c1"
MTGTGKVQDDHSPHLLLLHGKSGSPSSLEYVRTDYSQYSRKEPVHCGSILVYMSFGSKSHWNSWQALGIELARRGHNITVIAPFQDKAMAKFPNVQFFTTNIDVSQAMDSSKVFSGDKISIFSKYLDVALEAQKAVIQLPEMQRLIREKPKFDLAIVFMTSFDAGFHVIKEQLQTPFITFLPATRFPSVDLAMGNPINPSYIPLELLNYSQEMSFPQRVVNFIASMLLPLAYWCFLNNWYAVETQKVLGLEEVPDLFGMTYDAEFLFTNSHPIYDGVRPINHNTIFLGGLHVREAEALPPNLQKWIDEAEHGVIYVSYGSILTSSNMPQAKQDLLKNVFKNLKQRIIWKWETEKMEDQPDNVLLQKWCPQQDILAHPNVKLFITHGGLLSTQEALYHGVPMVYMPGFADQFSNAARAERLHFGRQVHWSDVTENTLGSAIEEILTNPSYAGNVTHLGNLFKDAPMHPLDRAVYYAEYVIRHGSANHLKPAHRHLNWLQFMCLDVVLFLVTILASVTFALWKIIRCGLKRCCYRQAKTQAKRSKKRN